MCLICITRVAKLVQGPVTLELFWLTMQSLWSEVETMKQNPMVCNVDITTYNRISLRIIGGIDPRFNGIKQEILLGDQLPSVEVAYEAVRKETIRLYILRVATSDTGTSSDIGEGLIENGERTQTTAATNAVKVFRSGRHRYE